MAEELLSLMRRRAFPDGTRLPPERLLAEQMGVSRSSVRDAVARLEALGHLEVRHGDGTYVREPSAANLSQPFQGILVRTPQGIADLLELRGILEPEVAALAAERVTGEQVRQLERSLRAQEKSAEAGVKLTEGDLRFHRLIAQIAGNSVVVLVLDTLHHLMQDLRDRVVSGYRPQVTLDDHRAIVQAIAARSPGAARQAMILHLAQVRTAVTADLRPSSPEPPLPAAVLPVSPDPASPRAPLSPQEDPHA